MTDDISSLVHSPLDVSREFVEYAGRIKDEPGLPWPSPKLNDRLVSLLPGTTYALLARPGQGKSSLSAATARNIGKIMAAQGRMDRPVVFVSLDMPIERVEPFFQVRQDQIGPSLSDIRRGRADIDDIRAMSSARISLPVWLVGRSLLRRKKTPPLNVENIWRAIKEIGDGFEDESGNGIEGVTPSLVVIDYVQRIEETGSDRYDRINDAVNRLGDLAVYMGCPILFCAQANRRVDSYACKLPGLGDSDWSPDLEKSVDVLLSIWRPYTTSLGEEIEVEGKTITITEAHRNLTVLKVLKQRDDEGVGQIILLNIAPQWMRIEDREWARVNLDNYGGQHGQTERD